MIEDTFDLEIKKILDQTLKDGVALSLYIEAFDVDNNQNKEYIRLLLMMQSINYNIIQLLELLREDFVEYDDVPFTTSSN